MQATCRLRRCEPIVPECCTVSGGGPDGEG